MSMLRLVVLVCALSLAGLTACDKKKPSPKPPTPTTQAASATPN
jgi:hypothetical protein